MANKKAPVDRIEIYPSLKIRGQFGWRYRDGSNGKKLAGSIDLYENKAHAHKMIKDRLFGAQIKAGTAQVFEVKR